MIWHKIILILPFTDFFLKYATLLYGYGVGSLSEYVSYLREVTILVDIMLYDGFIVNEREFSLFAIQNLEASFLEVIPPASVYLKLIRVPFVFRQFRCPLVPFVRWPEEYAQIALWSDNPKLCTAIRRLMRSVRVLSKPDIKCLLLFSYSRKSCGCRCSSPPCN